MNFNQCFPKAQSGIIIAADVSTLKELQMLINTSIDVPEVVAVKAGFTLALRYGLSTVVDCVKKIKDLPVIYDHQKAATDIPAMGKPFASVCREAGVKGVILFPQAGPKTLEAFVSALFENELTPIVGLVMTHPGYLKSDGGFISDNAPNEICTIALTLGVRSFVLPGNKPDAIQKFSKGKLKSAAPVEIMMPGIGTQGGLITKSFQATREHHPFAIIGSAIYKADNPRAALKKFANEARR